MGELQDRDAVQRFWASPHPMFGGFRLVPYATVASVVNGLDDRIFNTLPEQPQPKVSGSKPPSKSKPAKEKTTSSSSTSEPGASGTTSKPTPHTKLTDQPPENNPLEEPNIWATILKLEGRVHENKVAEGFQNWLRKTLDSSLFEVQEMYLYFSTTNDITNN